MTMEFGTMSHGTSVLTESLDCALESLTFGNSRCINLISGCKHIGFNFASECILLCIFKAELSDVSLAGYASLFEVSL